MKPSYTSTPRSMETAVFIPSADPFEYGSRNDNDLVYSVIPWVCAIAFVVVIIAAVLY